LQGTHLARWWQSQRSPLTQREASESNKGCGLS